MSLRALRPKGDAPLAIRGIAPALVSIFASESVVLWDGKAQSARSADDYVSCDAQVGCDDGHRLIAGVAIMDAPISLFCVREAHLPSPPNAIAAGDCGVHGKRSEEESGQQ